jgi:DamX protein
VDNAVSEITGLNPYGLISQERAEKFDLLGQLILNQREAVVVCGCEGIGKTTFLKKLKKFRQNLWLVCLLQGDEELTLAEIQKQLAVTVLQQHFELLSLDVQKALAFCQQRQQKIVLLIDDAAALKPGLLNSLVEYALQHPILRVVFTFTKEQLYLKSTTDKAVDDCYFVEIPPLTLSEIGEFVKNLPAFQTATKPPNLTKKLLHKLYHYTAGVPGEILVDFPLLLEQEQRKRATFIKIALLAMMLVIATALVYVQQHGFDSMVITLKSVFSTALGKFAELTKLLE